MIVDPNGSRFLALVADPLKGTTTLARLVAPHRSTAFNTTTEDDWAAERILYLKLLD